MSAPIIKWKTGWGDKIERVEVLRETDQSVFVVSKGFGAKNGERREAKKTDWHSYHDSWEQAHAYLIKKASDAVESARRSLEEANGKLGNIKDMKPPKEAE